MTKVVNIDENSNSENEKDTEIVLTLDAVKKDVLKINSNVGLFKIQSANEWINQAGKKPIQKMLCDVLWFENELCILFADTNIGKSILAVQIGESIASGKPINGLRIETDPQTVLYLDFELSDRQFRKRYISDTEPITEYQFSDNFNRAEIDVDCEIPTAFNDFETYLIHSIELLIVTSNSKILIIDNLTYLRNNNEKASDALPLMKHLKKLKTKYDLSILVLAHTPKRESSKPLSKNDLSGSKMLINFCDCSFAIGESFQDKSLRYIKQIKVRNAECVFDSENVFVSEIGKKDSFLGFDFLRYDREKVHLREVSNEEVNEIDDKVVELKTKGISNYAIAKELKINAMRVQRILKKQKAS